jgi:hypothetical protein
MSAIAGSVDFEGNPRVLGPAADMGADEFAPSFPGSGEDLALFTVINGNGTSLSVKPAPAGSSVLIVLSSLGGTFWGAQPFIGANFYATGQAPGTLPGFPQVHLDFGNLVLLVDGSAPPPLYVASLPPAGTGLSVIVPAGLAGFTLRLQGLVFSASAANGVFAVTDAHELVF